MNLQYGVTAISVRLLPLQYDYCHFNTTVARYDQYLPRTTYDLAIRQFCPLSPSIYVRGFKVQEERVSNAAWADFKASLKFIVTVS